MGKRLIEIKHNVRDYECMWSGIEDLYSERLGEVVPPFFFFTMSGVGNFIYLKGEDFRQAAWSNGMVDRMYDFMSPIAKFNYEHIEGLSFEEVMKVAKEEIEQGHPVILGPTDMYYLSYFPKIYKQIHIPIHYVMMVGYDDKQVYLIDGGIEGVQVIPYEQMELALNIKKTELGDKNGLYKIKLADKIPTLFEIAKEALNQKARMMLEPKQDFIGIPAMRQFANEFEGWRILLSPKGYKAALEHLMMYAGTVPQLPLRLFGGQDKGDILYRAGREKIVQVLKTLGEKYQVSQWLEAAIEFEKSGMVIEQIIDQIIEYFTGKREDLVEVPKLILQVADIEEKAYQKLSIR
ncbi:MAG: DUF4872 domain-containing protein [Cellulosilyticum sp.]|nr:DUF4872 domain-containing protein [Cellulosilyticum sp.]